MSSLKIILSILAVAVLAVSAKPSHPFGLHALPLPHHLDLAPPILPADHFHGVAPLPIAPAAPFAPLLPAPAPLFPARAALPALPPPGHLLHAHPAPLLPAPAPLLPAPVHAPLLPAPVHTPLLPAPAPLLPAPVIHHTSATLLPAPAPLLPAPVLHPTPVFPPVVHAPIPTAPVVHTPVVHAPAVVHTPFLHTPTAVVSEVVLPTDHVHVPVTKFLPPVVEPLPFVAPTYRAIPGPKTTTHHVSIGYAIPHHHHHVAKILAPHAHIKALPLALPHHHHHTLF